MRGIEKRIVDLEKSAGIQEREQEEMRPLLEAMTDDELAGILALYDGDQVRDWAEAEAYVWAIYRRIEADADRVEMEG